MRPTIPKFGESGWCVSHTGTKEVEGVRRERQDGEKKKQNSAKLFDENKIRKMCIKGPWENRPTTPTKKAPRAALSTMSTFGKVLHDPTQNTLSVI
jgi:hypothetical protein